MSDTIVAAILGIVEGFTEFLPVSSTGHMILAGNMLNFTGETADVFEVVIQFGAILSVFLLYRERFTAMLNFRQSAAERKLSAYHVAAGIVPVMGIAFLLNKYIKQYLFSTQTVIIGLIAGAVLMLVAERTSGRPRVKDIDKITIKQAFYVGLFQIFSLWPGFSRSGSTIAGGLLLGLSRTAAAEFSFIIAVPIMFTAFVYEMLKIWSKIGMHELELIAVGFIVAFVVAYISVVWFLKFLNKSSLSSFAYYRFVVAAFTYYYFFM